MDNSKTIFIKLFLCLLSLCIIQLKATEKDTLNYTLEEFVITTQPKENKPLKQQPITSTSIQISQIEREEISSPKDLSAQIPNLHIPDYGSGMTSSVYIRGLGARIDQPAVGLIVDNIPYLNKNNYDFDYFDLERIEMLRGPQGTLYGRNTMGGVMLLHSISPFYEKKMRFQLDYSTANTIKAKVSLYRSPSQKFGYSIAGNFNHTNGFFTNAYTSKKCDYSNGGSLRGRLLWKATSSFTIDNTISLNLLKQGGYAYAQLEEENFKPKEISYNDSCGYDNHLRHHPGQLACYPEHRHHCHDGDSRLLAASMACDSEPNQLGYVGYQRHYERCLACHQRHRVHRHERHPCGCADCLACHPGHH